MVGRTVVQQGIATVTKWRRGWLGRVVGATMFALAFGSLVVVGSAAAESLEAGD